LFIKTVKINNKQSEFLSNNYVLIKSIQLFTYGYIISI